jgi:hypothetical protein
MPVNVTLTVTVTHSNTMIAHSLARCIESAAAAPRRCQFLRGGFVTCRPFSARRTMPAEHERSALARARPRACGVQLEPAAAPNRPGHGLREYRDGLDEAERGCVEAGKSSTHRGTPTPGRARSDPVEVMPKRAGPSRSGPGRAGLGSGHILVGLGMHEVIVEGG